MVDWHSKYLERTFMCNGFVIIMTQLSLRMSSQGVLTLSENVLQFSKMFMGGHGGSGLQTYGGNEFIHKILWSYIFSST